MSLSSRYSQASIALRESNRKKIRMNDKQLGDHGSTFQRLTELVPNWETYLTPMQLKYAKLYLQYTNCKFIEEKLGLSRGAVQETLFGKPKDYKSAIQKLEEAHKKILELQRNAKEAANEN